MSKRPLSGIRVVDGVRGPLAMIGRYLADLGAEIDRFVPAEEDDSAEAIVANAGKRHHAGDLASVAAAKAIERAHIVLADPAGGINLAALRRTRPDLVTMAVSDFGESGPLSEWRATGPVLHALSAVLSRSGIRGREPLFPPGDLAYQCAAPQAYFGWCASKSLNAPSGVPAKAFSTSGSSSLRIFAAGSVIPPRASLSETSITCSFSSIRMPRERRNCIHSPYPE